jgi:hypothetical protein
VSTEQAYYGTCPADDPDGDGLSVLLEHPSDGVLFNPTLTLACPVAALGGECTDGGSHTLTAITREQHEAFAEDSGRRPW